MESVNILDLEKKAASEARSALKAAMISQIKKTFHRRSGALEKSNVSAKFRDDRLDRLTINQPHYSFKNHYGSSLTGTQKDSTRKSTSVKTFQRHFKGKKIEVTAHERSGGSVAAMRKNIRYKAHNHIARALQQTNALQKLATALGQNRAVLITSQIDF